MKKLSTIAGAVLALGLVNPAAALLEIDGGTFGSIPSGTETNDVLEGATWDGYYAGQLDLTRDARLRFEFIGFEAGFANQFLVGESTVFDTEDHGSNQVGTLSSPIGTQFDVDVVAGLIPFSFMIDSGAGSVANGSNPANDPDLVNFFLSFGDSEATSGEVGYIFLDDAGAEDDDNHDDLVVRVSEVPEPGMLALLGAGLLGLGAVAMRRRNS